MESGTKPSQHQQHDRRRCNKKKRGWKDGPYNNDDNDYDNMDHYPPPNSRLDHPSWYHHHRNNGHEEGYDVPPPPSRHLERSIGSMNLHNQHQHHETTHFTNNVHHGMTRHGWNDEFKSNIRPPPPPTQPVRRDRSWLASSPPWNRIAAGGWKSFEERPFPHDNHAHKPVGKKQSEVVGRRRWDDENHVEEKQRNEPSRRRPANSLASSPSPRKPERRKRHWSPSSTSSSVSKEDLYPRRRRHQRGDDNHYGDYHKKDCGERSSRRREMERRGATIPPPSTREPNHNYSFTHDAFTRSWCPPHPHQQHQYQPSPPPPHFSFDFPQHRPSAHHYDERHHRYHDHHHSSTSPPTFWQYRLPSPPHPLSPSRRIPPRRPQHPTQQRGRHQRQRLRADRRRTKKSHNPNRHDREPPPLQQLPENHHHRNDHDVDESMIEDERRRIARAAAAGAVDVAPVRAGVVSVDDDNMAATTTTTTAAPTTTTSLDRLDHHPIHDERLITTATAPSSNTTSYPAATASPKDYPSKNYNENDDHVSSSAREGTHLKRRHGHRRQPQHHSEPNDIHTRDKQESDDDDDADDESQGKDGAIMDDDDSTPYDSADDTIGHFQGGPGTLIANRYQIIRDLGIGTFGRVVECLVMPSRKERGGRPSSSSFQPQHQRERRRRHAAKLQKNDSDWSDHETENYDSYYPIQPDRQTQDSYDHSSPPPSHDGNHHRVAIKIVRNVKKKKYYESALIEASIVDDVNRRGGRGTSHCAILWESFSFRDHFCMVFESLGLSLYDFMKRHNYQPFPMVCIWDFTKQLLEALEFLHSFQLIHTDLKPENILLTNMREVTYRGYRVPESTRIKVIDFGGATYDYERKSSVVNTRQYRSPEVILSVGEWSMPSDLWSAGCILAELYSGELLFATHDNNEHLALMERIIGPFPLWMLRRAKNTQLVHQSFSVSSGNHRGADVLGAESASYLKTMVPLEAMIQNQDARFLHLLRRVLVIDPNERSTAGECLHFSRL